MADQYSAADLRERVRAHYPAAATATTGTASCCEGCGCGPLDIGEPSTAPTFYTDTERQQLPAEAVAASLGCGNPLAVADLNPSETVLDLGSGGGIDILLSARRVGRTGNAYGLDMTDEMPTLARRNAQQAGAANVEFLKGDIEAIPLPPGTVDVVTSNCVINLSTDKSAVFAEAYRVLKPGGRLGVTDMVAEDHLSAAGRAEGGNHVGCIAGTLAISEYRDGLAAAGFTGIEITSTHQVADGMHSAIIRAVTRQRERPTAPPERTVRWAHG